MKYIKIIFLAMVAAVLTTACSDDDLSNTSIFNDATEEEQTEFDKWIYENYTKPYNIDLVYRYQDYETNNQYNVVPADVDKVKALTIIMKHIWVEAYNEVAGEDFLKQYCFRKFQFIGSPEYNENGSIVLGTAEGGLKVTLFVVNWLNPDNIFIDSESPFPTTSNDPLDLNFCTSTQCTTSSATSSRSTRTTAPTSRPSLPANTTAATGLTWKTRTHPSRASSQDMPAANTTRTLPRYTLPMSPRPTRLGRRYSMQEWTKQPTTPADATPYWQSSTSSRAISRIHGA
jgi:hypothetical protein